MAKRQEDIYNWIVKMFFGLLVVLGFWFLIGIGIYILGIYLHIRLLQELALNGLLIAIVGVPLLFLDLFSDNWNWLDKNKDWISIILWLFLLILIYFIIAPKLGLAPVNCYRYPNNIFCNS